MRMRSAELVRAKAEGRTIPKSRSPSPKGKVIDLDGGLARKCGVQGEQGCRGQATGEEIRVGQGAGQKGRAETRCCQECQQDGAQDLANQGCSAPAQGGLIS